MKKLKFEIKAKIVEGFEMTDLWREKKRTLCIPYTK